VLSATPPQNAGSRALGASGRCHGLRTAIFEPIFEVGCPYSSLQLCGIGGSRGSRRTRDRSPRNGVARGERCVGNYTIFEGTSEIQRLVIARNISGIHIR